LVAVAGRVATLLVALAAMGATALTTGVGVAVAARVAAGQTLVRAVTARRAFAW
jgi:hypothetical protein